eukprot:2744808-Rhodomonas_salina.6
MVLRARSGTLILTKGCTVLRTRLDFSVSGTENGSATAVPPVLKTAMLLPDRPTTSRPGSTQGSSASTLGGVLILMAAFSLVLRPLSVSVPPNMALPPPLLVHPYTAMPPFMAVSLFMVYVSADGGAGQGAKSTQTSRAGTIRVSPLCAYA